MNSSSAPSPLTSKISGLSLGIWGCVIFFVIYQFILRVSFGVMAPQIMERFSIHATEFSLLGSLFYLGYASMQIPAGILLDHFGPLKIIPIFLFLCVAGFCLFTFSQDWTWILIGRILTGIGSACAFIGSLKVSHLLFPPHRSKLFIGITASLGLLGAVCGGLVGLLLEIFTLSTLLQGLSILGILLVFLLFGCFSIKKTHSLLHIQEDSSAREEGDLIGIFTLLKNPTLFMYMLSVGLIATSLYTFGDTWGASFLMQFHHLSLDQASTCIFLIYMGMVLGAAALSSLAEIFNSHALLIGLCGLILASILIILLVCSPLPFFIIFVLMFLFGLCSSQQILFFSIILNRVPKKFSGVTAGLTNMIIMLLGSISIYLTGILMDYGSTLSHCLQGYGTLSYGLSLGTIAGLVLLGALLFSSLALKESFKKKYSF